MYDLNTCFYITLKSSHSFYALCIIVNLCLFTDKYIFFIFRRYCNKNNTFPNVGHFVPLKISFNSSPGCVFFLHCCRHKLHRQEINIAVCSFLFSLSCCVCGWSTFSVSVNLQNPTLQFWDTDFSFFFFFLRADAVTVWTQAMTASIISRVKPWQWEPDRPAHLR